MEENIVLNVNGIKLSISRNITLLEALRSNGILISASCGGRGLCGLCRVKILKGNISQPTLRERELLGELIEKGWRLACQTRVLGETWISIPRIRGGIVGERIRRSINVNPSVILLPLGRVSRSGPSVIDNVFNVLRKNGLNPKSCSMGFRRIIPSIVAKGERVNLVYDLEEEMVLGVSERGIYGVAVDLGTTTVVSSLIDLSSGSIIASSFRYNYQIRYGDNLISRIEYATRRNGVSELKKAAVKTINDNISELISSSDVCADDIYSIAIAGNTVMTALVLGISPATLGTYPFEPPFLGEIRVNTGSLGLIGNSEAIVYTLPVIGGFVGGDVAGDILASGLLEHNRAMLIDIGTNGEVVVKYNDEIVATSVPAGPAFEGVGLKHGMMAVEGAIESFSLSDDRYRVIGNTDPKGICGTGYVDILAELVRHGLLERNGRLREGKGVRRRESILEFVVASSDSSDIVVTQLDIRKLQLVISAFKTAYYFLLEQLGIKPSDLEKVYVAGSFGFRINPDNAVEIGLLPRVEKENIVFIGNGSLAGAEIYLVSMSEREKIRRICRRIRVLNMPERKEFQKLFIKMSRLEPLSA